MVIKFQNFIRRKIQFTRRLVSSIKQQLGNSKLKEYYPNTNEKKYQDTHDGVCCCGCSRSTGLLGLA
jgi:hypothetical protein